MATLAPHDITHLAINSRSASPVVSPSRSPVPTATFAFLLRPENFHSLPLTVPLAFKNSPHAPRPGNDTPLAELLAAGHFRPAAQACASELTSSTLDPTNHRRIFELFWIRLTCLVLLGLTNVAAQEIKLLEDPAAPMYYDAHGTHLLPWDLRVLAVRLTALGYNDSRRSIMNYYDLAREARMYLAAATEPEEQSLWSARLRDLGMRVSWALVELEDVEGAAIHMHTLPPLPDGSVDPAEALLWLQLGDTDMARLVCPNDPLVTALSKMADGEFTEAVEAFGDSESETVLVNKAVCLFFTGHLDQASQILESLVSKGHSSKTLLLNLCTIYELVTDRNRGLKTGLATRVAAREPDITGWERANVDFKL